MCGIFGYIGNKNTAAQLVFNGLKTLEYRGYDSWGVAVIPKNVILASPVYPDATRIRNRSGSWTSQDDERIVVKKHVGKIGNATVSDLPPGTIAIGHTRWATHGRVTEINAHPHLDCRKQIALIHNGIIENYAELKSDLLKKGHKFISQTDSEVAVHSIEDAVKNSSFANAVRESFNKFKGLNAIIVINTDSSEIIAVRNGSPLVVGFGKDENFLASDAAALIPYTRKVYYLEDNEMALLSKSAVDIVNVVTGKSKLVKHQLLDWSTHQTELGSYAHFMLKEMHEQPGLIDKISRLSPEPYLKMAAIIKNSFGSYLVACGSASHVAIAGSYLFSKIASLHINWAVGSEFGYQLAFLTDKSLVIALSQSGETMDTLESVKKAKAKGAKIFALVNVIGSTLYREANYTMLVGAGPETAVASTKALTGKLAHLILIAFAITGNLKAGQIILKNATQSAKQLFISKNILNIKKLAHLVKDVKHIFIIGRGLSYPAALETAIKIKEIAYIHAEGMAAGELKHGPLALIETGSVCIAFLPDDETYGANLAGAMEMRARGGFIIGVSFKSHEVFDYYINVRESGPGTIIPNIIVGQLLAYYLTLERGFDPDKPRNLAKSVTVK